MFGLEILEVILGLSFVYLILSLICSAINEYLAALSTRRGWMLVAGIQRLLEAHDESDTSALPKPQRSAPDGAAGPPATEKEKAQKLFRDLLNHPLVSSLYGRPKRTWVSGMVEDRPPSYLPARTFATALLDVVGISHPDDARDLQHPEDAGDAPNTDVPEGLRRTLALLRHDSAWEVTELPDAAFLNVLTSDNVPQAVKDRISRIARGTEAELQKLRDSVEVWFNNAMDRVTGDYKRYTQRVLFAIGVVVAFAANADTVQIWGQLSSNDELRKAMADQAAAAMPRVGKLVQHQQALASGRAPADSAATDSSASVALPIPPTDTTKKGSVPADTTHADTTHADTTHGNGGVPGTKPDSTNAAATPPDSLAAAQAQLDSAIAILNSMKLKLGWDRQELAALGIVQKNPKPARFRTAIEQAANDSVAARQRREGVARPVVAQAAVADTWKVAPMGTWNWGAIVIKLVGLMLTAVALSLGAPFWFDMVNKLVNIRAAGRAPDERPRSPEAPAKRLAERPTK